jgi:acetyltransferase-like isoleucine patch superfamily enzyme
MIFSYRLYKRFIAKIFSAYCSKSFSEFGKRSVIIPPLRINGEEHIKIGNSVFLGPNCWLQVLEKKNRSSDVIEIGDKTSIVGSAIISGIEKITIEESVLIARNVYISDHMHQFEKIGVPIKDQGVFRIRPVWIKEGSWLGQNVVVGPGVTIGKGAAIGANSVVNSNIPDYATAAGNPAKIIRKFD